RAPTPTASPHHLRPAPHGNFIRPTDDMAQRLKQAGQLDVAALVKQLPKPTVPLWAVNQLARRHRDEVRALLDAGDRLRAAQQAAPRGAAEQPRTATAPARNPPRRPTHRGPAPP